MGVSEQTTPHREPGSRRPAPTPVTSAPTQSKRLKLDGDGEDNDACFPLGSMSRKNVVEMNGKSCLHEVACPPGTWIFNFTRLHGGLWHARGGNPSVDTLFERTGGDGMVDAYTMLPSRSMFELRTPCLLRGSSISGFRLRVHFHDSLPRPTPRPVTDASPSACSSLPPSERRDIPPAKTYPFQIDPFQQIAINCMEAGHSVLVAVRTILYVAPYHPSRAAVARSIPH